MDTTASQYGAFRAVGIDRISYNVPDSFFPIEDATLPASPANGVLKPGPRQWTNHLHQPWTRTSLRAWSRVQLPSRSTRNFTGTVMKRVGLPIPRRTKASIAQPILRTHIEEPAVSEDGMPARRVVRRLESYEVSDEEFQVRGKPLSKLEMAGLQMQAKADVAHCLKSCPTATTLFEARLRRVGHYVQTIPLKRRIGKMPTAGNRLSIYTDILGLLNTTPQFRVPSRRFSILPRQNAASPTLSPAALASPAQEPVTPAAVMEPPRCMSDAKSPTKRSLRHKSPPMKNDRPRLSELPIKLLPATTPRIEPSPTKPASPPPATPLSESRPLLRSIDVTPSTFPKTAPFGTAFADMQRYSASRSAASQLRLSPTALAITPCPTYRVIRPAVQLSPTKQGPSVDCTPSRPNVAGPATPRIFSNLSHTADLPSPVAILSTLFQDSPSKQSVILQSSTPQKPTHFDFGTTSPSFNSVTWLKHTEKASHCPARSLKKSSRRQSEPLVRSCLKVQSRRQTISPQKLVFQADRTFTTSDGLFSPVKETVHLKNPLAAPVPLKRQHTRQSLDNTVLPAPGPPSSEVVNIDMRQNPDLFGTKAISLSLSPAMGAYLPSIAENCSENESAEEDAKLQLCSPPADAQHDKHVDGAASSPSNGVETTALENAIALLSPAAETSLGLGIFESLPSVDDPVFSMGECQEAEEAESKAVKRSPITATSSSRSSNGQKLSPSPSLNPSFTPVNIKSPIAFEEIAQEEELIPESPPTTTSQIIETVTGQSHDYDSPGRDYMREFIRRSRPKRPSTTEAGSPVGSAIKRQPLGPKSPNTESPSKCKRKLEKQHDEHDRHESPLKNQSHASPRKIRRCGNYSTKQSMTANDEETQALDSKIASDIATTADEVEAHAEIDGGVSRRSSRLRNQANMPSNKSAIPTPIKIGRNSGPSLNSAVRSEQQDLMNQTRMNTRKNKGNSAYPAQFLARQVEGIQQSPESERRASSEREGRKCVNWSNPLTMYREDIEEKDKDKARSAKSKTSTKPKSVKMSGIAKPVTRAKTTADKDRTARLAEHFGMVSNGTPAKPQRSTRSRMRI